MIHIACVDISQVHDGLYQQLYLAASDSRKARADQYPRRQDAVRCVAADALLRFALTDRCGSFSPYTVEQSPLGKPYLKDRPDFHYSLSHSGKWVAIAWGSSEVGIDVERIDGRRAKDGVAHLHFAPEEQQFLFSRETEADRAMAFFRIWTAKESYVKYLGTGLATKLSSFNVLAPENMGVYLHAVSLEDACLCLCTTEPEYELKILSVQQLVTH